MTRFLKTLLLWLLLAALPYQGIAAAIQKAYGPMERGNTSETSMSMQSHQDDMAAMDMSASDVADDATPSKSAAASDEACDAKHKHATCSFCASCCVGATAPPTGETVASASKHSQPVVVSPALSAASFTPAGLERPPKRITA
jgi:hypothetical protein